MNLRLAAALLAPLMLAGCSGSGGSSGSAAVSTVGGADAQTATIGMTDRLVFSPGTVRAKVGTVTLTVDNTGRIPHNLVFGDESLQASTGTIAGGAKVPLKVSFDRAGIWTFECTFHSGMTGKVVVS